MHMKLLDPDHLKRGTERQKTAYAALSSLGIFERLAMYGPVLAGPIPIGLDTPSSHLEVFVSGENLEECAEKITNFWGTEEQFSLAHQVIGGTPAVVSSFFFEDLGIEILAQNRSVLSQTAVLNMLVEARLLSFAPPSARAEIMTHISSGMDKESAFAQVFEIKGDPTLELRKIAMTTDRDILAIANRYRFRV